MKYNVIKYSSLLFLCLNFVFIQSTHSEVLDYIDKSDILRMFKLKFIGSEYQGDSCIWDFSDISLPDEQYIVRYSSQGDSLIRNDNRTSYYHLMTNDTLNIVGFENQTTKMSYILPEVVLRYPVKVHDSISSYLSAIGEYSKQYEIDYVGKCSVCVEAQGVLITPDKDTLFNVLQIRTKRVISQSTQSIDPDSILNYWDKNYISKRLLEDTVLIESENIKWIKSGYSYPILESVKNQFKKQNERKEFFSSSFYYAIQEQNDLSPDSSKVPLLREDNKDEEQCNEDDKWREFYKKVVADNRKSENYDPFYIANKLAVNVNSSPENLICDDFESDSVLKINALYPIPTKDIVNINYSIPTISKVVIRLLNSAGYECYTITKFHNPDTYDFAIDMSSMPDGAYILQVNSAGKSIQRQIILRK